MGFFDFLKRKKQTETLKFSDVDSWLDEKIENKELENVMEDSREFFVDKTRDTHKLLDSLEEAGLQNDNIPVREKHIMEGHRRTYIMRVKRFLDGIEFPQEVSEIGHFSAKFSESLDGLTAESQKNFMVLNHFFSNEISRIIKVIQSMKGELSKLQSEIENKRIDQFKDVRVKLKQYKDDLKKKTRLEEELINRQGAFDDLKKLTNLDLSDNKLLALTELSLQGIGDTLAILNLARNKLETIV